MPPFGPLKRTDLIHYLKTAGFDGPYPRGKHHIMRRGLVRVALPNPHRGDVGASLLARVLREAGLTGEE